MLLDPEANDDILDWDPTHGRIREPLLKVHRTSDHSSCLTGKYGLQVLHFMRSMMYSSVGGRGIEMNELADKIGMAYAQAPSVFGFYSPDYSPGGLVTEAGMVAPEVIDCQELMSVLTACVAGSNRHRAVPCWVCDLLLAKPL